MGLLTLLPESWGSKRSDWKSSVDIKRTPARVALFGPPAEGSNYYNNFIPWPGTWSRLLTGIDAVISVLL